MERPVLPERAMMSPASTVWPTFASSLEQWPYSVVSPLPWSIIAYRIKPDASAGGILFLDEIHHFSVHHFIPPIVMP